MSPKLSPVTSQAMAIDETTRRRRTTERKHTRGNNYDAHLVHFFGADSILPSRAGRAESCEARQVSRASNNRISSVVSATGVEPMRRYRRCASTYEHRNRRRGHALFSAAGSTDFANMSTSFTAFSRQYSTSSWNSPTSTSIMPGKKGSARDAYPRRSAGNSPSCYPGVQPRDVSCLVGVGLVLVSQAVGISLNLT